MGFKRKNTFPLDFEGTELEGLTVQCRRPSLDALACAAEMQGVPMSPTTFRTLVRHFADGLVSWDLEDDNDQPIPATYEELIKQDEDFLSCLLDAWFPAVKGVDGNLGDGSSSGDPSLEASIPMEPLSASQAS